MSADAFSDDALGRALLKLHTEDPPKLFAELSAQACAAYDLPRTDTVHADTTQGTPGARNPHALSLERGAVSRRQRTDVGSAARLLTPGNPPAVARGRTVRLAVRIAKPA